MSTIEKQHSDCQARLNQLEDDFNSSFNPIYQDFQTNSDVIHEFNTYLDNVLGKAINGSTKTSLNQAWLNSDMGQTAQKQFAESKSKDLQEFLKNNWGSYPCWVTVGKEFGFATYKTSYRTYNYDKHKSTCNLHPTRYFKFLVKDHINLINNKDKRDCVRDFIQFRDAFDKQLSSFKTTVIDFSLPVKTLTLNQVAVSNKFNNTDPNIYTIINEENKDRVDLVEVGLTKIHQTHNWSTGSSLSRSDTSSHIDKERFNIYVSPMKKTGKELICFNDLLITHKECLTPYHTSKITDGYTNNLALIKRIRGSYEMGDTVIANWTDIINHPEVKEAIQKRINFYKVANKTLQYLKHKHAKLMFLHGSF